MKRTLALLCALVMALSMLPAISFAANDRDMVAMDDHGDVNFYVTNLDWRTAPTSNAQKFVYYGVSEGSGMFAMGYLINYMPEYFAPGNYTVTWSGGIIAQTNALWDDGEEWTDKLQVVANINYEGQTGGSPKGVAGEMYVNGGMYLMSAQYAGVQMGGYLLRLTMNYVAAPAKEDCLYEAGYGYYLPIDLIVYEFEYLVYDDNHSPKASENAVLTSTPWEEEVNEPWLTVTDGKILYYEDDGGPVVEPTEPPVVTVTETYYLNGEFYAEVTHDEGAEWVVPTVDVPEGYTFSGWTEGPEHEWYGTTEQIMLTLTIYYQYQDGEVFDTVVYTLPYGTEYSYASPELEGYTAYPAVVEGTLTEDTDVHVNYAAVPYYHVVIHFVDAYNMSDELYPAIEGTYPNGYVIEFEYPVIDGYTYENQGNLGTHTVTGDVEVYVKYIPNEYPLTIIYQYEDGTQAAEPYTGMYLYKRDYSVESPVIPGYTPDIPVVNGQMCIDGETIYVTYYANIHNLVIHYVDGEGNELYPDYTAEVAYGTDYSVTSPTTIPYWYPNIEIVEGTMGDEDVEVTVVYTYEEPYQPVPPTVAGSKAEIRARATEDNYKDIRFIFTVTFNDSYVTYKGNDYGPTKDYYKIVEFWSVLALETGKSVTVKGNNILAMYEDAEGNENPQNYIYTAVLKSVAETNWDIMVTATPYLKYTMGGVTETVDGPAIEASVNSAEN